MSPRLLRPLASGVHPEAAAWRTAVVANGGSVSASTLNAVSKFCRSIDAAGIRDRFYRLNMFCGTGLNAALVPLYRGTSLGGTQYGNTTDTNNGPFVSGDYAENNGLLGNTTTKWLNTGFNLNTSGLTTASLHMSLVLPAYTHPSTSNWFPLSAINSAVNERFWLNFNSNTVPQTTVQGILGGGSTQFALEQIAAANGAAISGGLWTASRVSATDLRLYNGVSERASNTTDSVAGFGTPNNDMAVFTRWTGSATFGHFGQRLRSYSVGLGMTAQQVSDYNTAMTTFQTALGRT
jgi:hypothetical protein